MLYNLKSKIKIKKNQMKFIPLISLCFISLLLTQSMFAQDKPAADPSDAAELAKKLSNPVASLISLPFQNNLDAGIGSENGYKNTTNIQPVIPLSLNAKWNVITRVILPVIAQQNVYGKSGSQFGLGDIVASAFLSPSQPKNGLIWGAGPVLLLPVATDKLLGGQKFGIGPTALILKQAHGWTYGALANQIWSVAGNADRSSISAMYLQPFLTYNYKSGAGLGVSGEITQNWIASNTTAYIIPSISGITKLGSQIVSLGIGPRIQVAGPSSGKSNFGIRASVTFVFPK